MRMTTERRFSLTTVLHLESPAKLRADVLADGRCVNLMVGGEEVYSIFPRDPAYAKRLAAAINRAAIGEVADPLAEEAARDRQTAVSLTRLLDGAVG